MSTVWKISPLDKNENILNDFGSVKNNFGNNIWLLARTDFKGPGDCNWDHN